MNFWLRRIFFFLLEYLGVNAFFAFLNAGKIRVLLYHNIDTNRDRFKNAISGQDFEKQMAHLKRRYNVVSITPEGSWQNLSNKRLNVLVTFDDGFKNIVTDALPILERFSISPCFFLISGCVETGTAPHFTNQTQYYQTLTLADMPVLKSKSVTIGSHSKTHRDFRTLTIDETNDELVHSKEQLTNISGSTVNCFAFPWGHYRDEQLAIANKLYRRTFIVKHGLNTSSDNILCRNEIDNTLQMYATTSGALDFFAGLLKIH